MNTIMKISSQGQIRIPKKFMEMLGMDSGDYVELAIENSHIVLKPRKLIDPAQGWYWTKEWQEMENEVDEDIEKGRLSETFLTAEQGIEWLKKWPNTNSITNSKENTRDCPLRFERDLMISSSFFSITCPILP